MTETLSADQAFFINKLTKIVLANLHDENFSVEKLAREAGMSRVTVYRKIKSIKSQNLSHFIREVRLVKALEMLQHDGGTVSEIAFRTGFGSPTYFIKCFHEFYGISPGEVKKKRSMEAMDGLDVGQPLSSFQSIGKKSGSLLASFEAKHKYIRMLLVLFFILSLLLMILSIWGPLKQPERSIVVLPFSNLSNNPENQYFTDGMVEDIINNLFRISEMKVISKTTAEYYGKNPMALTEMSRKLNVNYVLEGSVQRQENKVRIFVQLIDARNDQHLLSEEYEGELTNVLEFQSDIAIKVADALKTTISGKEKGYIESIPTRSAEAYDYYLEARFLLHKANDIQRFDISKNGLLASLDFYEKAIAADSNFAEAYAGLANAWYSLCAWGWYKPYYEGIQKALYYCNRALEIDMDCAEAHAIKGVYHVYPEHLFEEARQELQTSLRLNPNFATTHQWYAQLMMITGPIKEARRHVDIALKLEPYFWLIHNLNSWIYYFEEKYQQGIDACIAAQALHPNSSDNRWLFILHYTRLGEGKKAAESLQNIFNYYPEYKQYADEVMVAYNKSGIEGIFRLLIDLNMNNPIPQEGLNGHPFYIAWWYAIIGEKENSLYWLERTLEAENIPAHYFNLIGNNPDFDILRNDPRFLSIMEKAGLTPYNTRKAKKG